MKDRLFQLLLSCPLPIMNESKMPPEQLAEKKLMNAALDTMHGLINKPDRRNNTPLHIAAEYGFVTICKVHICSTRTVVL